MILDKIFKNEKGEFISFIDFIKNNGNASDYIYTLAEAHAIDLIAKTISKCEIQTFEYDKESKKVKKNKGGLYWTLNLQPNYNENGTTFLYKLATKLLTDKTALVIINKKKDTNLLYVADSYNPTDDILYGKTFSDIKLIDEEGNTLPITKEYNKNNSIYYSLNNSNLTAASDSFKSNASKILNATQKSYLKANTPKWRLKFPGGQPSLMDLETQKPISYSDYKAKITEGLFSDEEAVVLLSEMFDLINLNKDDKKELTDFEKAVKNICDAVAWKWCIPSTIFYGTKTEKSTATEDFITFAVDPYFEEIEDGFNVSLVGKEDYLKGEHIRFNRSKIEHKDILDSATGIDKLTSSGFSRNEINELLTLPEIDEDWADEHYITKNYANVKGGAEENG